MEEARKKELDFFQGSRHYSDLKNVGTGFLSGKLSTHLINAIRKQLPVIQHSINDGIINLERELEALGGPAVNTRGAMVHLILQVSLSSPLQPCSPISSSHCHKIVLAIWPACLYVIHGKPVIVGVHLFWRSFLPKGLLWTGCFVCAAILHMH